ncbi:hypothetical protein ICN84_10580 [Akkermansia glycaniphila]|uniref:hypothetical protein n=1 Tax=Akkermansia glycaniphila TaxID=1679444 RepID=UPI001C02BFDE|nr:hypothetical protein [Akkermansia glycaniphila]MBT9450511.1 hypothetical protein [Akkermansia glycaniphila]
MAFINSFIACITLSIASLQIAYSNEPDKVVLLDDFTQLFTPHTSEQELSMQEQTLANQAKQQKLLWQEGAISRYQYFTTVGNWQMTQFALSRLKTPNQPLSKIQSELAQKIIENFKVRIDTLTRLASAGQGDEASFIILTLNMLIFERDLAIATGESKDTVMQKQKRVIEQTNSWLAFVQKAVENHIMGLPDLQIPKKILAQEQNRLKQIESAIP